MNYIQSSDLPSERVNEVLLTHSYFTLGMLFERIRSDDLYIKTTSCFLLANAYSLLKEYTSVPERVSIWKYLTGHKIHSLKEQKKLQQLFCTIAALQDIGAGNAPIKFADIRKYFGQILGNTLASYESIVFQTPINSSRPILSEVTQNVNVFLKDTKPTPQKLFLASFFSNVSISKSSLLPYPYLSIVLSNKKYLSHEDMTRALEECMIRFDELKKVYVQQTKRIKTLGRVRDSGEKLYNYLLKRPVITAKEVQKILGIAKPNAILMIDRFIEIGILSQVSGGERNRIYGNYEFIRLFGLQ